MTNRLGQIQARFNKASQSYDAVACVQRGAAQALVNTLLKTPLFIPGTVLDVGTGTGYIPRLLLDKFPQSHFYLNDIAGDMIEVCKARFSQAQHITYLPGDMLALNRDQYDLVISNLALQWSCDFPYALDFLHGKSAKAFAFSTLLRGTFKEWQQVLYRYQMGQIVNYPEADEVMALCHKIKKSDQDVKCWTMDFPLSFDSPVRFMRYLKSLGASAPGHPVTLSALRSLREQESQPITVTYKIFFGIFTKACQ